MNDNKVLCFKLSENISDMSLKKGHLENVAMVYTKKGRNDAIAYIECIPQYVSKSIITWCYMLLDELRYTTYDAKTKAWYYKEGTDRKTLKGLLDR